MTDELRKNTISVGNKESFSRPSPVTMLSNSNGNSKDALRLPGTRHGNPGNGNAAHILVVEDDEPLRVLLTLTLEGQGYTVTCVNNGAEALKVCATRAFDLIFLDMMMPVMDGFEFLKRFRGDGVKTPVIVFTSLVRHDVHDRLMDVGVSEVLYKPVNIEHITQVTAATIKKSQPLAISSP